MTLALLAPLLIFAATPPESCQEAVEVSEPCRGTLVPHDALRTLLGCATAIEAEKQARVLDAAAAEAKLAEARRREAAQRDLATGCRSLLDKCAAAPSARVEWWQGPEVVVSLLVVAVGAIVAVVVLAVE